MYEKSLKTLEYDKIVARLMDMAASNLGREHTSSLKPITDIGEIKRNIEETDEALKLIIKYGNPPLYGINPIMIETKRVEMGGVLSPGGLLKIAESLRVSRALKKYMEEGIKSDPNAEYPNVFGHIEGLNVFPSVESEITNAIISEDEISDNASNNLRNIRRQIVQKQNSVKTKLDSIISSTDNKKYLQDNIVTMREGRYVVPVKQESRANIPGLIHDTSSSGATIFVEPMAVVELNNEIRELMIKEREEIEKILRELSLLVAEHSYEIGANELVLKELDFIFAKGKLALEMNAVKPALNDRGYTNIKKGRHPLLKVDKVVPIDIYIGKDFNTLVVTGPNTGGKTVTLKTIGLLTLMAQAGLFIPADYGSEIAVYDNVYADIGDEQSIEQSLSTFSSHMVNIVDILERAEYNSLALFDELGAGTDPTEGAVLAISILDALRSKKIRTVATTHYNQLKMYALTTEGVANAAMEFDVETLSPTYKLLIGVPGKSNAFEISKRLGLPDAIIDYARELVDAENVEFEDVLSAIESDRQKSEADREEADRLRREVQNLRNTLEEEKEKTREMRQNILDKARREAADIIKETKEEAELILDELKDVSSTIEKDSARRLQQAQDVLRDKSKSIDASLQQDILKVKNAKPPKDLKKGDTVEVLSLKQFGTVLDKPDSSGNVMVQVGLMKVSLPLNSLRLSSVEKEVKERQVKNIVQTKSKYIKNKIDLRGKNVEEAIVELDKYIDDAYLSGLKQVEVVHGKGTGALREGLKPYFKRHRHIKSTRLGEFNEGGDGVTIIELK